ncbi:MAG TPA: metal-sulfur cluster assembly factor [Leptospiraceae bacterium]|nr:metal-sulfur cluster assembly factor [Leptospiraceae bacterium]HMW08318.1 metal-sulfur cluster assembly factor [Leptospiraceae bacterium]HMX33823.1 metal-sulfur cluster assembly factor [Leptospiraceae bacterium]HMY34425.1 metal-sulfur cluster assembly factor [Leptospiraceae bacterium]HMZ66897.1 metal-sulfur cluster assembly factor [Leptospiraceae bacterium]
MEELRNDLEKAIYQAILPIEDPELFISIMDLGLVYDIKVNEENIANIKMTFTSMACPAGPSMKSQVLSAAAQVDGIKDVNVEVVWNPKWDPRIMASEDAKMQLGIYD